MVQSPAATAGEVSTFIKSNVARPISHGKYITKDTRIKDSLARKLSQDTIIKKIKTVDRRFYALGGIVCSVLWAIVWEELIRIGKVLKSCQNGGCLEQQLLHILIYGYICAGIYVLSAIGVVGAIIGYWFSARHERGID